MGPATDGKHLSILFNNLLHLAQDSWHALSRPRCGRDVDDRRHLCWRPRHSQGSGRNTLCRLGVLRAWERRALRNRPGGSPSADERCWLHHRHHGVLPDLAAHLRSDLGREAVVETAQMRASDTSLTKPLRLLQRCVTPGAVGLVRLTSGRSASPNNEPTTDAMVDAMMQCAHGYSGCIGVSPSGSHPRPVPLNTFRRQLPGDLELRLSFRVQPEKDLPRSRRSRHFLRRRCGRCWLH